MSIDSASLSSDASSKPTTFPIRQWVDGAARQTIRAATRVLCARTAAFAATNDEDFILDLEDSDIPEQRVRLWAAGIHCERTGSGDITTHVDGFDLDPYQVDALTYLSKAGGTLALGCGLGKTLSALAYAHTHGAGRRLWVVCPVNAFGTWERHRAWCEQEFSEFKVMSMDSAHKHALIAGADPLLGGTVIFDEAHMLGVSNRRRTKHSHEIRWRFDVGVCLTGTLLHAGIEKTLSILDLAVPGGALFTTPKMCGRHFRCLARKEHGGGGTAEVLEKPTGEHREAFMRYISRNTVSLSSRSSSVRESVDLPPQTIETVKLGEPWESMDQLVAAKATEILEATGDIPHLSAVLHAIGRSDTEAKLEWLGDELDSEPLVISAGYLETLDLLEQLLAERGISYGRIDGSVTGADREQIRADFQAGKLNCVIGQVHAMSVAMDLFRAAVSVSLDHSWSAVDYDQFLARTCRRGQSRPCLHLDLVSNRFQARVVTRARAGQDFNSELTEWQDARDLLHTLRSLS